MSATPDTHWGDALSKVVSQHDLGLNRPETVVTLTRLRGGDFSVRLPMKGPDVDAEIASLFNDVVTLNEQITEEFKRLSLVVGKEGRIEHRVRVRGATGGWEETLRAINELIDDMVQPTTEVAPVRDASGLRSPPSRNGVSAHQLPGLLLHADHGPHLRAH